MRRNAAGLRDLIAEYDDRDDVRFVVVYQREPHARQMAFGDVPQPKTCDERIALARRTVAELALDVDVWVDDMGDQSRAMFGDLPHPAIVIDPAGAVALKLSWCDPKVLAQALSEVPVVVWDESRALAEAGFLAAIENAPAGEPADVPGPQQAIARHHRHTMLAHLAISQPAHLQRGDWLQELAAHGPHQQRTWAQRLLQAPEAEPSPPGTR